MSTCTHGTADIDLPISPDETVKRRRIDSGDLHDVAQSSAEPGSAVSDSKFPMKCILTKDDRGVYTLLGTCDICGEKFSAVGTVSKKPKGVAIQRPREDAKRNGQPFATSWVGRELDSTSETRRRESLFAARLEMVAAIIKACGHTKARGHICRLL